MDTVRNNDEWFKPILFIWHPNDRFQALPLYSTEHAMQNEED